MSYTLVTGDCRSVLATMQPESIDSVITDPPYELGFMSKAWDQRGVAFDPATWAAVYRVLKPGARLLAFGGSRTHHRIWCAIEDAGFVLEDTIMWLYGSGFPKHRSKLKPAFEPICVARKGPVSDLNIDGCRLAYTSAGDERETKAKNRHGDFGSGPMTNQIYGKFAKDRDNYDPPGRWPANVVLDGEAAAQLDAAVPDAGGGFGISGGNPDGNGIYGRNFPRGNRATVGFGDFGGASRFYYVAKADRAERNAGLEGLPKKLPDKLNGGMVADREADRRFNNPAANHHPTVKPLDLMRWLVRLVTPANGIVLDPFTGSGTTGVACIEEGRQFVGIDQEPEYVEIARRRIANAPLSLGLGA